MVQLSLAGDPCYFREMVCSEIVRACVALEAKIEHQSKESLEGESARDTHRMWGQAPRKRASHPHYTRTCTLKRGQQTSRRLLAPSGGRGELTRLGFS